MKTQKAVAVLLLIASALSTLSAPSLFLSAYELSVDFVGVHTYTITGINTGETITVEKIPDLIPNGLVDANERSSRTFKVTDGVRPSVAGLVNPNVPGDDDGAVDGNIRIDLPFPGVDLIHGRQPWTYIIRVTASSGQTTRLLYAIPAPTSAYVYGRVNTAAYATVLVADYTDTIFTSVRTDSSGYFSLSTNFGPHIFHAYADDRLTVGALQILSSSHPVTKFVSGRLVDADTGAGLPSVFLGVRDTSGGDSGELTDANGDFSILTDGTRHRFFNSFAPSLAQLGYVRGPDVEIPGDSPITIANVPAYKANAVIYGKALTTANVPISNLVLRATSQTNPGRVTYARTSASGDYFLAVTPGTWNIDTELAHHVRVVSGSNVTSVALGEVVRNDFSLRAITAYIRGTINGVDVPPVAAYYLSNSIPIKVEANVRNHYPHTYEVRAWAGEWFLQAEGLESNRFNRRVNFTVVDGVNQTHNYQPVIEETFLRGRVMNSFGLPATNIVVRADATIDGINYQLTSVTDGLGFYIAYPALGTWKVSLDCDQIRNMGFFCLATNIITLNTVHGATVDFNIGYPTNETHLFGKVVDQSGAPLSGKTLLARSGSVDLTLAQTSTADGSFDFRVFAGPWTLTLSNNLPAGQVSPTMKFTLQEGDHRNTEFKIWNTDGLISGSLKTTNGVAIAGIGISAVIDGPAQFSFTTITDSQGNYSLAVPRQPAWIVQPACQTLNARYYNCPTPQIADVTSGAAQINFISIKLPEPPILKLPHRLQTGDLQFTVQGDSFTYDILASPAISLAPWSLIGTVNIPNGTNTAIATVTPGTNRFFRLYAPP